MTYEYVNTPFVLNIQEGVILVWGMIDWCRARGGRGSGGQAKIVGEAARVLITVVQADS
jgi:hypothetical protein